VPKSLWPKAGELGLLCPTVPEEYGGLGLDFGYNAIVDEESAYYGEVATGFSLQSDIVATISFPMGRKSRRSSGCPSWSRASDHRDRDDRTGHRVRPAGNADNREEGWQPLCHQRVEDLHHQRPECRPDPRLRKTDTEVQPAWKGVSIILVEAEREGFKRGRNLDKIGQDEADTSELFFEDVRVPITNCLGEEGKGFIYLMSELPQERLSIAVSAQAAAQKAFDDTVEFTRDRKAFGKPILDFQNSRFVLADLKAKLQVGWAHLDWALTRHLKRELTPEEGAAAKLWHTELQWEVDGQVPAAARRRGLYERICPIARAEIWRYHRRASHADFRRHQRDHEGTDRAEAAGG
jgi:acyl-CoA dehydrogenase